jgi:hypothetical protein
VVARKLLSIRPQADLVQQALAADRNQPVSHRQLAADAVVSRPLKRGVRSLVI